MTAPLPRRDLLRPGLFKRMLGLRPPVNALAELVNIIADGADLRWLSPDMTAAIEAEYKVSFARQFATDRRLVYGAVARHLVAKFLRDETVERAIAAVRAFLRVDDDTARDVGRAIIRDAYVEMVGSGGEIGGDAEFPLLYAALGVAFAEHDVIFSEAVAQVLTVKWREVIEQGFVTPDAEAALGRLAASAGVRWAPTPEEAGVVERARRNWSLLFGTLPVVDDPRLSLRRGERIYWRAGCTRHEWRTERIGRVYAGPAVSVPIVGGLRFRVGALAGPAISHDVIREVDAGELILTNHRVIFLGQKATSAWRHEAIVEYVRYTDAIEVRRSSGKNVILTMLEPQDFHLLALRMKGTGAGPPP